MQEEYILEGGDVYHYLEKDNGEMIRTFAAIPPSSPKLRDEKEFDSGVYICTEISRGGYQKFWSAVWELKTGWMERITIKE